MLHAAIALMIGLAAGPSVRAVTAPLADQLTPLWFMIGEWKATGDSSGASAGGESTIEPELHGRILVRRDHVLTRGGKSFDIYMVVYPDNGHVSADFIDTEGHTIHYAMTPGPGRSAVFEATGSATAPGYRLTYAALEANRLHIRFEIAAPGGAFKAYAEGDMARTWPVQGRKH